MRQPLQIGITGGIGSGKSLVCRIFKTLGVPVYDADSRAKDLMTTDQELIEQIKVTFGNQTYLDDGKLNRLFLGRETFGNPERLKKLNALVHPRVAQDYLSWVDSQQKKTYLLREAALLYETGIYKSIDKMIVISSPVELRIKRVMSRDPQRTRKDIETIMNNQWPEEEKIKRADFLIYNDDQHLVIPQVLSLHEKFISLAAD